MSYKTEFPDFDYALPVIVGLTDQSWHNDVCPVLRGEGLAIWCDYIDIGKREQPEHECPRFLLCRDFEDASSVDLYRSDDIEMVRKAYAEARGLMAAGFDVVSSAGQGSVFWLRGVGGGEEVQLVATASGWHRVELIDGHGEQLGCVPAAEGPQAAIDAFLGLVLAGRDEAGQRAFLGRAYEDLVGYDPFEDDPGQTVADIRAAYVGVVMENIAACLSREDEDMPPLREAETWVCLTLRQVDALIHAAEMALDATAPGEPGVLGDAMQRLKQATPSTTA